MRKIVVVILFFVLYTVQAIAQNKADYYYYKGEKRELTIDSGELKIVCPQNYISTLTELYGLYVISKELGSYKDHKEVAWINVSVSPEDYSMTIEELKNDDNVLFVSRIIKTEGEASMSDRFLVNLNDRSNESQVMELAVTLGVTAEGFIGFDNWFRLKIESGSVGDALYCSNVFFESGLFKDVDPCFDMNIHSAHSSVSSSNQWAIDGTNTDIDALGAWDYNEGNNNVKIAIVDGGIASWHPTFNGTNFGASHAIISGGSSIFPGVYNSHGTELASVIASNHTNGVVYGIAPGVTIMDAAVEITGTRSMLPDELAQQISWSYRNGADIINCSWGSQGNDLNSSVLEQVLDSALYAGRNGKGCIVVFAAGNENQNRISYPGNYNPDILVVGGVRKNGNQASYSNSGPEIDIAAPSDSIFLASVYYVQHASMIPQYTHEYINGTSYSAAFVSGIAGLLLSEVPSLTRKQATDLIERSAQKVGTDIYDVANHNYNGSWNRYVGHGLVNAKNTLCTEICNTTTVHNETIQGCHVKMHDVDTCGDLEIFYYSTVSITDDFYLDTGDELFLIKD